MILKYTVPESGSRKLSGILSNEMRLSSTCIRRLKKVQGIFVDGEPRYTNYMLKGGETVSVNLSLAEPPCDIIPESGSIDIVYENEAFLVLNKPQGMLIHPSGAQNTDTLANYAAGYLEKSEQDYRCHAVNRLDRGTSGLVIFAKNSHFMDRCVDALKAPDSEKIYTAVVLGRFPENSGTIDLPIYRPDSIDMRRTVDERGQNAVTHYRVLDTAEIFGEDISLISLRLETGRTHQIRVHCSHLGHPILGDRIYNTETSRVLSEKLGVDYQCLSATELKFTDPLKGEKLSLSAPPCFDWAKIKNM